MSFFEELKRRNVVKMAVLYVVVSWLLLQVADVLFPNLGVPDWAFGLALGLLILFFFPVLVASWVYEITPEGLKREGEFERSQSVSQVTGRKMNTLIVVLLVVAIAVVAVDRLMPETASVEETAETVEDQETASVAGKSVPERSIAVLPFVHRSALDEDIFFVDGIHDDIVTQLANIGSLSVISRTSVEKFRSTNLSMKEIGGLLGVKHILEGSVQRSGGQVHINVQLIDVAADNHLWANTYDRQLSAENVFAIQGDIAMKIAAALDTVLSPTERSRVDNVPTINFDAYEAYLRGRQSLVQRKIPDLHKAVRHFERAIKLDPEYALAHVGLAEAYGLLEYYGDITTTESVALIEPAVNAALSLDPQLGAAYTARGSLFRRQNDLDNAIENYLKAIELSPGHATSYHWLAELYRMGRQQPDLAWPLIQKAVELDPLSPVLNITLAETLDDLGLHGEAIVQAERAVEIAPNYPSAYFVRAFIEAFTLGRMDRAIGSYRAGLQLDPESIIGHKGIALVYSHLGADDLAIESIERAIELGPGYVWSRFDAMQIYDAAGMADRALQHARFMHSQSPVLWYPLRLLRNADISAGNPQAARDRYLNFYTMFDGRDSVEIDIGTFRPAVDFAELLLYMGQEERARLLLQSTLDYLPTQSRLGRIGREIDDVRALAQLGESERALTALAEAVESGWRYHWRSILRDRGLDSIRDDPRFRKLEAILQADMAAQLEQVHRNQ
jgi:TolB-like protein/Tfp pilus assembly protein PilF